MSTMRFQGRRQEKVPACSYRRTLACIPLLLALVSCQTSHTADSSPATLDGAGVVHVLDIEPPGYRPREGQPASASEASVCAAWILDAAQAEKFLALSRPLPDGALHRFGWLPCTIAARVRWNARAWRVEINAAGTSVWRSGDEVRLLGCGKAECEPFVLLMPD